ncbi:16S rRNA (cytidine1402-2'-O)-methyltransferase [Malonomonas rubra DSM 5091]|uniref:Ribosomal RNA small subunit methyltransferase I n=1 Tax=Malonomonas rubra DSM 5091 TaxID=1122189 RepID=A0A1M6E784_MALRU|nr:16S rRNA (cytidine(1402)-2'-O)-methyltransferase [Malonomonas rubra]SHI81239.1 16S rRNA (cytidine1402-2'-O)-methyltransferase [Malonomonas rubra DSM 5091]
MSGILYVVATPIGNLEDMTYRAVRVLQEVDLIAAEDTRHSRKLLEHYGIKTPLISYHEHNEEQRAAQLIEKLQAGQSLALISDAGTPCIADPGYRLVFRCRAAGVTVAAVPGASALIAALSIAGLPTDAFRFVGFLPAKSHGRRQVLEQLKDEQQTVAFYEGPHRLQASLQDIADICGEDRLISVARELTKRHEELFGGTVAEALEHYAEGKVKGELVLLLGPAPPRKPQGTVKEELARLHAETDLTWKQIVKQVAKDFNLPGSDVYKESLELRGND